VKVNTDVTISVDATSWQLPREKRVATTISGAKEIDNPFVDLAILGKKIQVIWPIESEWFVAVAGVNEFELPKVKAVADAAGEHKSVAESTAEQNTKHFKAVAEETRKAIRAAAKRGEQTPVKRPGFEVPFEIEDERPAMMPRKQVSASLADWANAGAAVPAAAISGQPLTYWQAASLFQEEEQFSKPLNSSDQSWLKSVFGGRETVLDTELRQLLAERADEPATIVAIRTA
jgi:hypothetical protein